VASSSITGSGPYVWDYSIAGDSSEQLVAGNYATCMGGTPCGTFFTIYDFKGYVPGSAVAPANWTVSVMLTGLTPAGQAVTDDPSVVNLVFQYTGVTIASPGTATTGFDAESIYNTSTLGGTFSYEAQKILNLSAPDQGQGPLAVPGPVSTPEPASMSLLAGGLALYCLARLRSKT
jgi:hypothetical protein